MRFAPLLAFAILMSILAPLAAVGPLAVPSASAQDSAFTWTVAIYMSGDNTLSENVQKDLDEIAGVGTAENVRVVALADEDGTGDSRLRVYDNGAWNTKPLSDVNSSWGSELSMGAPATLRDFASWAFAEYPSQLRALDLWGHGSGWPGVCMDRGDWLTLPELSSALRTEAPDLISLDACQMGMVEVAYQLRESADVLVASEKDVPAEGWQYGDWLGGIGEAANATTAGTALAKSYISWALNNSAYSATASVIDLSAMAALGGALDAFAQELWSSLPLLRDEVTAAREATERYDGDAEYDLVHFARNVAEKGVSARLARLGEALENAAYDAIAYSDAWTRLGDEPAENANGLSIWLPDLGPTAAYSALDLSSGTGWNEFLSSYADLSAAPESYASLTTERLDRDEDGALDACALSLATDVSGSVIFELSGPGGVASSSAQIVSGGASATLGGLSSGAYLAAAYVYGSDGKLKALAELPEAALIQSWLYVNGSVSDGGGPVSGATVEIGWGGGLRTEAVTDSDGTFSARMLYPTQFSNGTITAMTKDAQPLHAEASGAGEVHFRFVLEKDAGWLPLAAAAILLYVALLVGIYGKGRKR